MIENRTLLVVDNSTLTRNGLIHIIKKAEEKFKIYEASNNDKAIKIAVEQKPDLILMCLHSKNFDSIVASKTILEKLPTTKILFLSECEKESSIIAALLSGASGYLLKNMPPLTLNKAISLSLDDFLIFNKKILPFIKNQLHIKKYAKENKQFNSLSLQQQKILKFVYLGLTNKEVGKAMNLSDKTVRNYLSIIFNKLGISKRLEAALIYSNIPEHLNNTD